MNFLDPWGEIELWKQKKSREHVEKQTLTVTVETKGHKDDEWNFICEL